MAQQIGNCASSQAEVLLDANNVSARINNNGVLFYRDGTQEYRIPKNGDAHSLFAASILIGGFIDGDLRMSGTRYRDPTFWSGPLDELGNPPVNCSDYDRLYSVRRTDIEAFDESGVVTDDLLNWPTGLGAPTLDANGSKIDLFATPLSERRDRIINLDLGERPAIIGDQSIWWIMNDRGNVHESIKSEPIGLEVHGFAFSSASGIASIHNSTVYRYRIFNRNRSALIAAYFGLFVDPDLGSFDDDYLGSDTLLGMAFAYNSNNNDRGAAGYGISPPAIGIHLFHGPAGSNDSIDNDRDGLIDEIGERMQMTNMMAPDIFTEFQSDASTPDQFYNHLRARWRNGTRATRGGIGRDYSEIPVNYFFPGDPVAFEFWSEVNNDGNGSRNSASDRTFYMSVGPFDLEAGADTEIVFSVVWARGKDNLDSVAELRIAAQQVQFAYETGYFNNPRTLPEVQNQALPNLAAALGYNYPEPFRAHTTIMYRLPHPASVRMVVFDVLGRIVETLVHEPQDEGEHMVTFDGTDLPSGVYFYRIEIGHATATRSMMLVK